MAETDPAKPSDGPARDDFQARLAAARERRDGGRDTASAAAARNTGQLDRWLGTSPWFLLVFLALGFAAGMMNMLRTVRAADAARRRIAGERGKQE